MPQNYNACSPAGTPPTQSVNNTNAGTPVLGYAIGFPYIAATDIVVFTGDTGNWTLRNQGTGANEYEVNPQTGLGTDQVVFVGGTPGANILITRRTDLCEAARVFQAGASIRAEDLNADMNQLRFLIQELNSWLEMFAGNEGDELVPGENPSLDDLSDIEITTPANPSWLRWNGTQWEDRPILEDGDAWVADDDHVVTSAAGDDRWLTTGGGTGGTIAAGDGISLTTAGTTNTIAVDLATDSGLGFNSGELEIGDGDGLVASGGTLAVDLATTSGLEFDSGDLRIDANDGCEIVAAGLNAETTAASIVQTGTPADNADPAIRVATTLGGTTTNNDLQIVGGTNVTVTRDNDNQLTITSSGGGGIDVQDDGTEIEAGATTLNFTGAGVTVTDGGTNQANIAIPGGGSGITVEDEGTALTTAATTLNFTGAGVTASGTGAEKTINIPGGSGTSLWENDSGTIQTVDADRNVRVRDASGTVHQLNSNGSAVFNEQGDDADFRVESNGNENMLFVSAGNDRVGISTNAPQTSLGVRGGVAVQDNSDNIVHLLVRNGNVTFNEQGEAADFRVESDTNENMLFVDGDQNRVGIGEASPSETLDVRGNIQVGDGNNLVLQNGAENQAININADDATASYTVTLPPTAPTANGQVLSVASGTTDVELEWATGGGTTPNLDDVTDQGNTTTNAITVSGITILNGDGSLNFGDDDDADVGRIRYNHTDDQLEFNTNGASRWNMESNGDWRSSNFNTATGVALGQNGFVSVKRGSGNSSVVFQATAGSTKNIELQADGTCSKPGGGSWTDINSERRLKQNIEPVDATAAWETVKTLPYYSYQFIDNPEKTFYGPVVDECPADMQVTVYVEDEDGNQVVRADAEGPLRTYDNLLRDARLFVALQEALKRIETLEAKVQVLESQ